MEAITAAGLLRRGILPSVYLYAVDGRILKYKHAVARGVVEEGALGLVQWPGVLPEPVDDPVACQILYSRILEYDAAIGRASKLGRTVKIACRVGEQVPVGRASI